MAERGAEQVVEAHLLAQGLELIHDPFRGSVDGHAVEVALDGIRRVAFTGRDAAAGKSWQAWLEKRESRDPQARANE